MEQLPLDQLNKSYNDKKLEQSKLISTFFDKFNDALSEFRQLQQKLENKVQELQNELSIKNQQLNNIIESLPNGLIVTNSDFKAIIANKAALNITELNLEDLLKQDLIKLFGLSTAVKFDLLAIEKLIAKGPINLDYLKNKKLELTFALIKSENINQPQGLIINIQDISLLKNLQAEADRKNRLMAMGQIAASVAHEIRNPLGGMGIFVSMLKKDLQDTKYLAEINQIQSAMKSMNHIIENILEFTRPKKVSFNRLDLVPLIAEFVEFNRPSANFQNIKFEVINRLNQAFVKANAEQLKQVFQNIFVNAAQAIGEGVGGGAIKITTTKLDLDFIKNLKHMHGNDAIASGYLIEFADSGEGMSEELLQHIFEPFYTTKEKGTGLGLAIVKQIIEAHNGLLIIDSKPQQGTKIYIALEAAI